MQVCKLRLMQSTLLWFFFFCAPQLACLQKPADPRGAADQAFRGVMEGTKTPLNIRTLLVMSVFASLMDPSSISRTLTLALALRVIGSRLWSVPLVVFGRGWRVLSSTRSFRHLGFRGGMCSVCRWCESINLVLLTAAWMQIECHLHRLICIIHVWSCGSSVPPPL